MIFNYEFNNNSQWKAKYIIYLITNTVSQKYYIGQTRRELRKRWNQHKNDLLKPIQVKKRIGTNIKLKRSVQSHFKKLNHTDFLVFSILEVVDALQFSSLEEIQNELNKREIFHIRNYRKLYGKNKVCNVLDGGKNYIPTEEENIEMSKRMSEYYKTEEGVKLKQRRKENFKQYWQTEEGLDRKEKKRQKMFGKTNEEIFGIETALKIKQIKSKKLSGENNPMYGRTSPLKGVPMKEETKQKLSKSKKGKSRKGKNYDLSANPLVSPFGEKYTLIEHVRNFSKIHNLLPNSLRRVINGERKSYKGWRLLSNIPSTTQSPATV